MEAGEEDDAYFATDSRAVDASMFGRVSVNVAEDDALDLSVDCSDEAAGLALALAGPLEKNPSRVFCFLLSLLSLGGMISGRVD